jgi:DegV family protein with EDD domain
MTTVAFRAMPNVAVVTDTTHYLPRDIVAANDITEVSLYVNDGERTERESGMPDFNAFYDRLRASSGDLPTTSQPSIGDFLAAYEPLVQDGRDVVSIHISEGISGTVESARQAAAEIAQRNPPGRVEVIDSRTTCGALGMIAMATAAAARSGAGVEDVAAKAREACAVVRLWFAVDTLEFLRRGGRIGAAQAWLGGALKVKPILTVDGEITPIERVRTSGRAFERMVDYLQECNDEGADGWVVQHIQVPGEAERIVERGREIFGSDPLFVSEIGPVIGAHVGPGLVGVGGIPRALLA